MILLTTLQTLFLLIITVLVAFIYLRLSHPQEIDKIEKTVKDLRPKEKGHIIKRDDTLDVIEQFTHDNEKARGSDKSTISDNA